MTDIDLTRYEGHTPGPWNQKKQTMFNHPVYICGATRVVADVVAGSGLDELPLGDYETRANADLIADAPLLLAEVKRLREDLKVQREMHAVCLEIHTESESCLEAEEKLEALRQSHARLLAAAAPFVRFADQWDRNPIRGLHDTLYVIHSGHDEGVLRLSDCKNIRAAVAEAEAL